MTSTSAPPDLISGALQILETAIAAEKAAMSRLIAARWRSGKLPLGAARTPPDRPARPERPELRPPKDMPKRRAGGEAASRVALLHAVAHIELNAIDLAWDILARFPVSDRAWYDDWVQVADEEAKHFELLAERLAALDARYGDLPAHDGLWQMAERTAGDVLDRLALVPMVLEARGLDVTPTMIQSFEAKGDRETAAVLHIIHAEEIGHVATGRRWFERFARAAGADPAEAWRDRVRLHYRGVLKRPFDAASRAAAGLDPDWYEPLAAP